MKIKKVTKVFNVKGFTLVELTLYLALLPVLLSIGLPFMQIAIKEHQMIHSNIYLTEQSRMAVEMLRQDLLTADADSVHFGGDDLYFTAQGKNITYVQSSQQGFYRDLNDGAGAQPILSSHHISLKKFFCFYPEQTHQLINLNLEFYDEQTGQSVTAKTAVYLWNSGGQGVLR
ncbi:MAG: hypothetical protein E6713_12660 [Sporomusaceae bacterium]|nr:hypothetical protein [Sporomusaceae bacterium]